MGYEVCYVDLPDKVSGFATVIAGEPLIVVNRTKPKHHTHYTVSHELGHHLLHLNPSRHFNPSGLSSTEDLHEYQVHMFASTWVWFASDRNEEREAVSKVLVHFASSLFSKQPAQLEPNR